MKRHINPNPLFARCGPLLIATLLFCLPAAAQRTTDVRTEFDQSRQVMLIRYRLEGLSFKREVNISPYIENDDRKTMKALQGDHGWIRGTSEERLILWDPFRDGVTRFGDLDIALKVESREAPAPDFWGLGWQGSNSAPFGLKFLRMRRFGFFAGIRLGLPAPSHRYLVTDGGVIDYKESGVYEITGDQRLAGLAATGGAVFQIGQNLFTYVGAGYGYERLYWKYNEYNQNKDLIGTNWALNESVNTKGVTADAGLLYRFAPFWVEIGGSSIDFKSYQVTLGVGLMLSEVARNAIALPLPVFTR